ncbi:hypothetical protein [Escherichia phage dw-ec]|nr:hypothetical protein [Escherichia phage dw-ec]
MKKPAEAGSIATIGSLSYSIVSVSSLSVEKLLIFSFCYDCGAIFCSIFNNRSFYHSGVE